MKSLLPIMMSALLIPAAQAGHIEITFQDVDKYSDIDSGREPQKRYTERVLNKFEEFFTDVAAQLPEENTLHITVKNIDLAGDTRFGSGDYWQVRLMTDLYSPWMTFYSKVLDDQGNILYQADEKIRDYNYLSRSNHYSGQFDYEEAMIKRWGKQLMSQLN